MSTTRKQSRARLSWALALLVSGLLYTPLVALAQTTEATESGDDEDEETPLCPGRPLYLHPIQETVAKTGLSFEVLCIIRDTDLGRHDPQDQVRVQTSCGAIYSRNHMEAK
jgi:hypothetical protein